MSAKRFLVEKVARTRMGATLVLADEGPAEGDPGGKCTQKWPESEIYKGTLFTTVFQKCASHEGGEQILQKRDRSLKEKAL